MEQYRYLPGPTGQVPRHIDQEYQLGVSSEGGCYYNYRGTNHATPAKSLCVIHPGELHYPHDDQYVDCLTTYRMMLIPPRRLEELAAEMTGTRTLPFFPSPVITNPGTVRIYEAAHHAFAPDHSRLTQDSLLLALMTHLILRYSEPHHSMTPSGKEHQRVKLACDYLQDHYGENVSLEELAAVVGLSAFHFARVFRRQTGLTPHVFQVQARIARAKILCAAGMSLADVAAATGFCDQSHFGWHFKKLVGIAPSQYHVVQPRRPTEPRRPDENSKNLRDSNTADLSQ